jgi:hypothetical protein
VDEGDDEHEEESPISGFRTSWALARKNHAKSRSDELIAGS